MSNSAPEEHKAGLGVFWWVALGLVLYVLSIGPVAVVAKKTQSGQVRDGLLLVYYSIIWLHDHTPLKRPLEIYVELWGVK